ncbi:uncharacterized protein LOC121406416 [Lytechinus variegatus]|uniref:uncharacterized protein LOC121406416 n=1 Tax=Lytechinus variegatus TaxID=7654 RepID=UPI001BB187E9|nr:uncharacterized protein LOC121406416 [Lytechinus variegatus]
MGSLFRECKYGWIVVVGRFISGFIEVGTVKSFGVLLPDVVTHLNASSGKVGLAFGLCHGLTFGLGPLTSALYRWTQSRWVMVIGTLIAALSITLASFATDGSHLLAALIFTGLGYSLMCLPTIMALNKHFVERFALAYGVAQTGPAVGMIVLPVVTENLAHTYGWKGALFLLGAINFHMMITAVVTREPEHVYGHWRRKKTTGPDDIQSKKAQFKKDACNIKEVKPLGSSVWPNGKSEELPYQQSNVAKYGSCMNLSSNAPKAAIRNSFLMRKFKSCDEEDTAILSDGEFIKPQLSSYRSLVGNEKNLRGEHEKRKSYHGYGNDAVNCNDKQPLCSDSRGKYYGNEHWAYDFRKLSYVSEESEHVSSHERLKERDGLTDRSCCSRFLSSCKSAAMCVVRFLDLELMRDAPALIILQLSFILLTSVHVGWMIFLVPHAVGKGIPIESAVFLSSVGGVGNLIGRIVQGPIVDKRLLTGVQLSILLSIVNAITFAIDPLLQTLPVLCVDAFFSGLCSGALIPLVAICVKEVVPRDRFANAIGLVSLSYGVGEPLGGYLAGKLSDVADSYEKVFLVFGGLEIIKALLLVVVAFMVWRESRAAPS